LSRCLRTGFPLALAVLALLPVPASASGSLSIHGFIHHFFSQRVQKNGQTVGYDNDFDGKINVYEEGERVDSRNRVWQAHLFLHAVRRYSRGDFFLSRAEMRAYLSSFDKNDNGRIETSNGEFQHLYRTIWHQQPPRTPSYTAFEKRFHG
jgi:hypothetical protein